MKKIAVWQMKGGVGKTTTSFNVAANLAHKGYKVLCLDLDIQCNLTSFFEKDLKKTKQSKPDIGQILEGKKSIANAWYKSRLENLYFVRGSEKSITPTDALVLDRELELLADEFHYCIMDCHPDNSLKSQNALVTADLIVTPMILDNFSRDNLNLVQKQIFDIDEEFNTEKHFCVFVNRIRNLKCQKQVYKDLIQQHDYPILANAISESSAVYSALLTYKPLYLHRKNAQVTKDFELLTEEIEREISFNLFN